MVDPMESATPVEITSEHGLTVTYDEKNSLISFEWDPDTHPEYNYLEELTDEEFSEMINNHHANFLRNGKENDANEVQSRGSGS